MRHVIAKIALLARALPATNIAVESIAFDIKREEVCLSSVLPIRHLMDEKQQQVPTLSRTGELVEHNRMHLQMKMRCNFCHEIVNHVNQLVSIHQVEEVMRNSMNTYLYHVLFRPITFVSENGKLIPRQGAVMFRWCPP